MFLFLAFSVRNKEKGKIYGIFSSLGNVMSTVELMNIHVCENQNDFQARASERLEDEGGKGREKFCDANKANGDFLPFPLTTHTHSLLYLACTAVEQFTTHREFNIRRYFGC